MQDTYLTNITRAPLKLSNLKQPIYYKLLPEIITNYGSFFAHHDNPNYKLMQDYYKLQQKIITNYGNNLLKIPTKSYYKLQQLLCLKNSILLQITSNFITYYRSFQCYYKLRQILLQITAGVTNYVVTAKVSTILFSGSKKNFQLFNVLIEIKMNDGKDILKIHWKKLTLQLIRSVREQQTAMANPLQTGLHKRQ